MVKIPAFIGIKTEKMKNYVLIVAFLFFVNVAFTQQSYRKDSLQIKVYTEMTVNKNLTIEGVKVISVFCEYCSEKQKENFGKEAINRTKMEINNPKYRKEGVFKLAHYLRISKKDFSELK